MIHFLCNFVRQETLNNDFSRRKKNKSIISNILNTGDNPFFDVFSN